MTLSQAGAGEVPGREPASLAVEDLEFSYGDSPVLFGVSLAVHPGEALALLGTNGAGKSTLLRVVCGLERPGAGRVLLDGADVTGASPQTLLERGVALVQGGSGVFPDMTVAENLDVQALTLRRRRDWTTRCRRVVLETFPALAARLSQRAGSLSGGEQQQLALAKALVVEPRLLCIDELSLGLAPIVVEELLGVVRAIHQSGVTVVLVEQSLNIAASLCERAVFLEKGMVRFEGLPDELLTRHDIARAVFLGGRR
jgi:ABC-type branched-subunit amino acid transport system ATPase component